VSAALKHPVWIQCVECRHVFRMSPEREKAIVELAKRLCPMHQTVAAYERHAQDVLVAEQPRPQAGENGTRWT
jgi:uncharacterized OsmC-like protein